MLQILLILFVLALAGLWVMWRFLRNVQPDEGEIASDLKELKAKVAGFKGGFVAWDEGISSSDVDQILEKSGRRTGSGVFLSAQGQPIFAYAFRKYIGPGENSLCYIISAEHELIFRTTTKGTELTLDGQKMGLIRANGKFYDTRNDEVASIRRQAAKGTGQIYLGQVEAAKIALPDALSASNALELTASALKPEQEALVRSLAVFELIENLSQRPS